MRPWTVATVTLAAVATACALSPALAGITAALIADPEAVAAGQWWRLATGPLIHGNAGHLAVDAGVLLVVGLAYERRLGLAWPALILIGLVVPTAAVLIADPGLTGYYGTSGLTHALLAAVILHELRGPARRWAAIAGLALIAKLVFELSAGPIVPVPLDPGARQVPLAHLAGVLVACVAVGANARWAICPPPHRVA